MHSPAGALTELFRFLFWNFALEPLGLSDDLPLPLNDPLPLPLLELYMVYGTIKSVPKFQIGSSKKNQLRVLNARVSKHQRRTSGR